MCFPGTQFNPNGYTPTDFAKEGYINKGNIFGFTQWEKPTSPVTQPSSMTQNLGGTPMQTIADGQPLASVSSPTMQQLQPKLKFSFNAKPFFINQDQNNADSGVNTLG
jgi:hypothetical protein